MACHIRRDDQVEVVTGEHQGQRGKVLRVMPKKGLVLVQGVNMVYRHVRPSRRNPQGVRLQKEAPIHISNVQLVCPNCDETTRVGVVREDGVRKRVCKKCNEVLED